MASGRSKETVVTGGGCSAAVKVEGGGNVREEEGALALQ